jgi:hypothetical protein
LGYPQANWDQKKEMMIIGYGLLRDQEKRPVVVGVYACSSQDLEMVPGLLERLQERFQLERVVLAGDQGLLNET